MNKLTKKMPVHFTLALGDNFYFDGVKNVNDPRFQVGHYFYFIHFFYNFLFIQILINSI